MTLLVYVREKNYDMCVKLLENGADPNMKNSMDQTPVYFASQNCDERILKLLLDYKGNPNIRCRCGLSSVWTPLHIATYHGHRDIDNIVELLLSYNANPNMKDGFGQTPLHIASYQGYDNLIKLFLKYQANINIQCKDGRTPLHCACKWNKITSVRLLLEAGANLYITNNQGLTAKDLTTNKEIISLIEEYEIDIKEPAMY